MSGLPAVPDPGWAFRAGAVVTLAAAALLVLWLARQVTARGLGNGVVVLLTADILGRWYSAAPAQWRAWSGGRATRSIRDSGRPSSSWPCSCWR